MRGWAGRWPGGRRPGRRARRDAVRSLRDRLARALGDPTLELGYWSADARAFIDDGGGRWPCRRPGSGAPPRRWSERDGRSRCSSTTRRSSATGARRGGCVRHAPLGVQRRAAGRGARAAAELIASRRRLLVAGDDASGGVGGAAARGPRADASAARAAARPTAPAGRPGAEHVERARRQLAGTLDDLHELAHGLHPRELAEAGLPGALASLAERCPVPVELDVRVGRLRPSSRPPPTSSAPRRSPTSRSTPRPRARGSRSPRPTVQLRSSSRRRRRRRRRVRGTGLQGLADRVEALGGTLRVDSPPGGGTRLAAEIPLGGEAR